MSVPVLREDLAALVGNDDPSIGMPVRSRPRITFVAGLAARRGPAPFRRIRQRPLATAKSAAPIYDAGLRRAPLRVHEVEHVVVTPCSHLMHAATHWSKRERSYPFEQASPVSRPFSWQPVELRAASIKVIVAFRTMTRPTARWKCQIDNSRDKAHVP
jgi:hypothetical protein